MLHVVIDSSIYRTDPKRQRTAFRALTRLARGKKIQLHIPHFVKQEFVTQQCAAITDAVKAIRTDANDILRTTGHKKLVARAAKTQKDATDLLKVAAAYAEEEFSEWLSGCHAIQHTIKPDHGQRVADDYFVGGLPFTSPKHRLDIPDSFIWHTILDLAHKHAPLYVIAQDGALHNSAGKD